jgi:hypothetical protein
MKMFVAAALLAAVPFAAAAQAPDDARAAAQLHRSDHSEAASPAKARKHAERSTRAFASAPSARAFDGSWSVLIETRAGACDPTFRYGVDISNGNVINAGGAQVQLAGHVAPSGAISVSVASGDQEARGVGRLSGSVGRGTWRGAGSRGVCAGIWEAERRG